LGEFPWSLAFLYASLVVVTGPTVINPLLRQVKVDRKVSTLLEGEGVLIDPVGAILAVVVLDIILNGDTDPSFVIGGLIVRLGIGTLIGVIGGGIIGLFLKRASFLSEDLRNLVVLAGLWGLFGLAQTIRSESGLMTTVVAGIVVRALSVPDERLLTPLQRTVDGTGGIGAVYPAGGRPLHCQCICPGARGGPDGAGADGSRQANQCLAMYPVERFKLAPKTLFKLGGPTGDCVGIGGLVVCHLTDRTGHQWRRRY
jgi:hypothetical protein